MVHEGVVEPVLDSGGKRLQILSIQGKGGDNLLMEHPVHEAPDGIVPHAVPHDVEARQIGPQHEAGVGAVENTYLALFIGGHVGDYRAVEARPLKG